MEPKILSIVNLYLLNLPFDLTNSSTFAAPCSFQAGMNGDLGQKLGDPIAQNQLFAEGESVIKGRVHSDKLLPRPAQGFPAPFVVNSKDIGTKPVIVVSIAGFEV